MFAFSYLDIRAGLEFKISRVKLSTLNQYRALCCIIVITFTIPCNSRFVSVH